MTSVHQPPLPPLPAHARAGHVTVNKDIPTIRLKQVSTVLQNPDIERDKMINDNTRVGVDLDSW